MPKKKTHHTKTVLDMQLVIALTMLVFFLAGMAIILVNNPKTITHFVKASQDTDLLSNSISAEALQNDLLLLRTDPISEELSVLQSIR